MAHQPYWRRVPSIFGADALDEMSKIAKESGKQKAFLVCDKGVEASGGAQRVADALTAAGLEVMIYSDVFPDPTDEAIDHAGDVAKEFGADVVVGCGGGSPMDTAKGTSVLLANPEKKIKECMTENGGNGTYKIDVPVYLIPTAAGTGAEGSPMCVIHELESDGKKVVERYADLAVLEPTMTYTCPDFVTVNSGLDALAHAIEALTADYNFNWNPWSTTLSEDAVRIITKWLPVAVKEPENYEARAKMLYASNAAGDGLANLSVHIGHCFGHEAGMQFHLNHGYACGIALPEVIDFVADKNPQSVKAIAACIGVEIPEGTDDIAAAKLVSDWLRNFMREIGMVPLKDMKDRVKDEPITREKVVALAHAAIDHNWFHIAAPGDVSYEQMEEFCGKVFDNYQ